jgi:hypothetical protein
MTMGLLDSILGRFNGGDSGGSGYLPPSGGLPDDQVSTAPTDPYGNPVGGFAPGVPLPRPRPPQAGPPAFSPPGTTAPDMTPPGMQPGESGGTGSGLGSGGLAAALGLDPDRAKTAMAALAGGLSNVKNSPFAGQVAANAAGGAIAGGNKAEDTAINQALKLQQVRQKAPFIDEETRKAAQADREGTLAQARDALTRDRSKRAAIIARLDQLGIAF